MTGLGLIGSFVLFLGGIALLGNAFLVPDIEGILFVLGILLISASFALGFHILPKSSD